VICTRDRPQTLALCVGSLSESFRWAFPGASAHCYIFDDSTTPALSAQVRHIAAGARSAELEVTLIDRERQHLIDRRLAALSARSASRALGQGSWDLAGVRNFAFLLTYCYSGDDDVIVFLDDDILLSSRVYEGRFMPVDGVSLIRELVSNTPARQQVASGASYLGRFDGSILDHLRLALDDARDLSLFPSALPVQLTLPGARIVNDGPGISGALLATTPASLASHFLPACYDEDWIWLALLGQSGAAVRTVASQALHAAPPQPPVENGFVTYQNTGEVIYRAVRDAMKDAPSGGRALSWCENRISPGHFLEARRSVIGDIRSLREDAAATARIRSCLKSALEDVEALSHTALYQSFRRYLELIPSWRSLLPEARELIGCNPVSGNSRRASGLSSGDPGGYKESSGHPAIP
jgi:hypothetical protein